MALRKNPTRDDVVFWYSVDLGEVVRSVVKHTDKFHHVHFRKEQGCHFPPPPQPTIACHRTANEATQHGIRILLEQRSRIDQRLAALRKELRDRKWTRKHKAAYREESLVPSPSSTAST